MKHAFLSIALLAIASSICSTRAQAQLETYKIDPSHSSIKFSIRHFVAKTTGNFAKFEGILKIDRDDPTNSSVEATVQVSSVNTNNRKRDNHLQEDDYFSADSHPKMTFKSTKWEKSNDADKFKVTGDLTIRSITREVVLDVELLGIGPGREGATLSGWEATTTLDRTWWDVNGGRPAVGTKVNVTINIEAIQQ